MSDPSPLSYCAEQVRLHDRDRFATAMFAEPSVREHLFALYAFNIEIAKVCEVVTEPIIGRMRLQWWRDTLDRLYDGEPVAHAVAQALGAAIAAARLNRAAFDRLIDTREIDIDKTPPADIAALKSYAEGTGASLLSLALQITGAGQGAGPIVANLAGTAWALTGLLRAIPFHARQRRLYMPEDRLLAFDLQIQRLFDLKPEPRLAEIVREVGLIARELLGGVEHQIEDIEKAARSPAMVASLAQYYLADLERAGWDPFALERREPRRFLVAKLGLRALIKGY